MNDFEMMMMDACEAVITDNKSSNLITNLKDDITNYFAHGCTGKFFVDIKKELADMLSSELNDLYGDQLFGQDKSIPMKQISRELANLVIEQLEYDVIEETDLQTIDKAYDQNEQIYSDQWFRDIADEEKAARRELRLWREYKKRHPEYSGRSRDEDKELMAEMRETVLEEKEKYDAGYSERFSQTLRDSYKKRVEKQNERAREKAAPMFNKLFDEE